MMMQRIIFLVGLLTLASAAWADQWKQCAPMSTKINSVKIHDCDPVHSTPDRCALEAFKVHNVEVNYVQPKPIELPSIREAYSSREYAERTECDSGLVCPGTAGQVQHFNDTVYFTVPANGTHLATMRITVRESGTSIDNVDHLCVDLPVLLVPGSKL